MTQPKPTDPRKPDGSEVIKKGLSLGLIVAGFLILFVLVMIAYFGFAFLWGVRQGLSGH